MENETQNPNNRVQKIEEFLLNPEETLFNSIEEITQAIQGLQDAFAGLNPEELETLKGQDGVTPQRGVDYMNDEDLAIIEEFILERLPQEGIDFPNPEQVREFVRVAVSAIPRIKGDKGEKGEDGKDGKDGSPDTGNQIKEKIRTAGGLEIGDIKGLSRKIKDLKELTDEFDELKEKLDNVKMYIPAVSDGGGGGGGASYTGEDSVNISGTVITLVGDTATPGNSKYYGTDGSGNRGWHNFPSGGVVSFADLTGLPSDNTALDNALNLKADTSSLGTAAYANTGDFATATQGSKADSAVQPSDLGDLAVKDKVTAPTDLDATGTPSATTFLAGDNTWKTLTGKEDVSNKVTSISGSSTDTQYPSAKLLYDQLALKANDNAVVKLTGNQTVAGNKNFTGATQAHDLAVQFLRSSSGIFYLDNGEYSIELEVPLGLLDTDRRVKFQNKAGTIALLDDMLKTRSQASTATLTPSFATATNEYLTAQAASLTIANPTLDVGQRIVIWVKDNGTARAINFGSDYKAFADNPLPTTTVVGKWMQIIIDKVDTNVVFVSHLVEA